MLKWFWDVDFYVIEIIFSEVCSLRLLNIFKIHGLKNKIWQTYDALELKTKCNNIHLNENLYMNDMPRDIL